MPEDHVPVAAEVQRQQVIVAEPDEELPGKLGHSLGHGGQAASQHRVQVLVRVILRVQERVRLAILQGQGAGWRRGMGHRGWGAAAPGQGQEVSPP